MFNPFTLEGKTIIITGASSGIGRQCAIDCSKMGARVILVARNEERLKETLSLMDGKNHIWFSSDLSQISEIEYLANKIRDNAGKIDGLIHAAGIELTKPLKLMTQQEYITLFNVNAISAFELTKQFGNMRSSNQAASFIFIASISSIIARNGLSAYAASKGAIVSAMRIFALELAKRKIRVNCISPGTILTPMMQKVLANMEENEKKKRIDGFPLGLGDSSDISNACLFLLSDASRWITGQNIIIDGGYTIK